MASVPDPHRCIPCEDGRKLLIAAVVARLGWALASGRFSGEDAAALAPWAAIAVSALAPVLAYRLAINLRLSRAAALAAGVILAVHPALVDAAARGSFDAAEPALAGAFLVAWVYAWQSGAARAAALAGLLGAGAALTGTAAAPAALAVLAAAAALRRDQPRWKVLAAAVFVFGAVVMAPAAAWRRSRPVEAPTEWSVARAVTPAVGRETRLLRGAFAALLLAAGLLGFPAVTRGPGGWFALAWLAGLALARRQVGGGPPVSADPALAVFAGAGLARLLGG